MAYYRSSIQNPRPVYPDSGKQMRRKNDVPALLAQNQKQCCELEALMEAYEVFLALPEKAEKTDEMRRFLSEQDSYRDEIDFSDERELKFLSLTERPQGRNLLAAVEPEFAEKLLNISGLAEAETLLRSKLRQNGLELSEFEFKVPIPADMRRVIRMEFDGAVERPDADILSPAYRNREIKKISQEEASSYSLGECPAWQKFAKFENFRRMEGEVREALAFCGVAPDMVREMRVSDMEDTIWQYRNSRQSEEYQDQPRINIFEGSRGFFVKTFAKNHEKEFRDTLKSLGCNDRTLDYAIDKLKKGKLPKVQLPGNKHLVPTVHHDHAIRDAGQLKDPTQVNNVSNLRMMFDVRDGNLREQNNRRIQQERLEIEGDVSLNLLQKDKAAKKQYVKQLASQNFEAIFKSMRAMGIETDKISQFILDMHGKGDVKPLETRDNHYLSLDLKKTEYGMRLVLGEKEWDNERDRGMHKDIMHGIDGAPLSVQYDAGEHKVVSAGEMGGKNAYEVEGVKGVRNKVAKLLKRITFKKNPEDKKPMAVIAGFDKVIYSDERDLVDAERRFDQIAEKSDVRTLNGAER